MAAETVTQPAAPAVEPARTAGLRRWGAALGLFLAPWGFVVTNTCYAWAIRDGGSDATGAEALALFGAHPLAVRIGVLAGSIACLLMVPAVLGLFRLAPRSRLVLVGGSLMIAGYVSYLPILDASRIVVTMAERGGPLADYAAVIDASQSGAWGGWLFGLFVLGNLVGTLLVAIGLFLSRAAGAWPPVAIACWPVLHVIGLVWFGNEIPQVIGAILQAVGLAACAVALLRTGDGR